MEKIEKSNPVPLYWQLAQTIKNQISSGELKPGDKLPTEAWLAETYGLSRVTVRRAVQSLIDNGTLRRKRGESPTVAYPRMSRQTNHFSGLSEDLRAMGHVPSYLILCYERTEATMNVAEKLNIQIGDPVVHLSRLRLSDGVALGIHDCYYPLSSCGKALTSTFHAESVIKQLEDNGIYISYATQVVQARNATKVEANLLSVPVNSALLCMKRVSFTEAGDAVEYSDMIYNPELYELHMELSR